jgi:membrane-anchored protein YejM (alkaline phosphatase superfamily)
MDVSHSPTHPPARWQRLAWLTLFTALNAGIASAIALGNTPLGDNPGGALGLGYLALALPGHFLAFGALVSLVPLALGLWTRSPRPLLVSAVVLQGLWLCLLLVDAKVFALYRFHLNAMVLNMVFGGALQDQVALSWQSWLQAAAVLGAVALAEVLLAWACRALLPTRARRRPVLVAWAVGLALMATGQVATAYYDARGERAVTGQWVYLPWAQPITAKRHMRRLGVRGLPQATLPDPRHSQLQYPLRALRCQSHTQPNVLVVVLESLRSDALDAGTMPNTWALAQRSEVYTRHYSTGNATRYGLFGLLYGLPGGYWQSMLAEQRGSLLFDVLTRQGYDLHLYGSAPLYSPEFDRTVFAQVREQLHTAPSNLPVAARDRHIVEAIQADIARAGSGHWFGFVFLDSTHAPYHLPDDYPPLATPMATQINFLGLDKDHDATPERNRYRTALHYADAQVGALLQSLRDSGQADNTIVLVTGDHAEEFNDLGLNYWGHNGNFSDYQMQVPFVLHWPGRMPGQHATASSHEDWVPTLLRHGLGCENALADFSTGQDLFDDTRTARPLLMESWSQRGIHHGDRTYLFDRFGNATTLDNHYLPLLDQQPDPAAVRTAWDALTHFRKH